MASLCKSGNVFIVKVCLTDGRRSSIRLGRCTPQNAAAVKRHIERMQESVRLATPLHGATSEWLSRVGDPLHDRLVRAHLCKPKKLSDGTVSVSAMADAYLARRVDLKPQSLAALRTTRNKLVDFFGSDRPIGTLTAADAQDFRRMASSKLAAATTAKVTMIARQFFADAVNREWTTKNPFV